MDCQQCGAPLAEGTSRCPTCGAAAPGSPCARCGGETIPGKRYCTRCGLDLTKPYSRPSPSGDAPALARSTNLPPERNAAPSAETAGEERSETTGESEPPPAEQVPAPSPAVHTPEPVPDETAPAPEPEKPEPGREADKPKKPETPAKTPSPATPDAPAPKAGSAGRRSVGMLVAAAALVLAIGLGAAVAFDLGGMRTALGSIFSGVSAQDAPDGEPEAEASEQSAVSEPTPSRPEDPAPDPDPGPAAELVYTSELAIEPTWAAAGMFDEHGLARVRLGDYWGLIDDNGDYLMQPLYLSIGYFHEGLAVVDFSGSFGYIDLDGDLVIEPQFSYADNFSEGLAVVYSDNKYGYINAAGELIVPCRYNTATAFSEGYAVVSEGSGYYFIDEKGAIASPSYEAAAAFSNGRAAVRMNGKWGYVDYDFDLVIDYQFEEVGAFQEERAVVRGENGFHFIDREGAACSIEVDRLWQYSEGRATALVDGLYGFLGEDGDWAVEPAYRDVWSYAHGLCPVTEGGGTWYYIDPEGNVVIDWDFEEAYRFYAGLARVMFDGQYGFLSASGTLVEGFHWEDAGYYSNGMIAVCRNGRWGYLRITEQEVYF